MGKATLQAFDVGEGDCVFLKLENNSITFSIMIDCGKFSESVKRFVLEELGNHINLLIITHIDNDHIDGVKKMLEQIPDLVVDKIIFNCVQGCNYSDGVNFPKERLVNIKRRKDMHFPQPVNTNISAPSALSLTELIMSNENLRRAWATQPNYITSNSPIINLPEGFGTLSFLSPEKSAITKLDKDFREAFNKEFYTKYNGPYDKEATLYELLLLAHEDKRTNQERKTISSMALSDKELIRIANVEMLTSLTPENMASLAFIWESGEKRILFCGDASPEVIVYQYLRKYHTPTGYACFEAIKVPHHGSKNNCGAKFWETFDSNHIFICGASKRYGCPSMECLSKIITRATESQRFIHYTTTSDLMTSLCNEDLQNRFNYMISRGCLYEFDY